MQTVDQILMILPYPFDDSPRIQRQVSILSKKKYRINVIDVVDMKSRDKVVGIDGLSIHHVRVPKLHAPENVDMMYAFKALLWYLTFYSYAFVLIMKLHRKHGRLRVHCYHIYSLPLGILCKKILKCKIVYDACEFGYYYFRRYAPRILVPLLCEIEKRLGHNADLIFTWWRTQAKFFKKQYGLQSTIFPNLLPPDFVTNTVSLSGERKTLGLSPYDFVVLFAGSILPKQYKLYELLDAIELLVDQFNFEQIKLLIVSPDPKESLRDRAKGLGIAEHCIFLGGVPYREIPVLYRTCDVVYAEVEPTDNQLVLPSGKIFEAMLCKKPVITCHLGEKSKLVNEAKCGLTIKPEVEEIARAFLTLAKDAKKRERMGINGYNFYLKKYSWEKYSRIFLSAYEKLLSSS
jgi:glycosyltransferase involved in cell wall biosynthesis